MAKKIGIVSTKNRAQTIEQTLSEYEIELCIDGVKDLRAQLIEWDELGFTAAIVDDAGIKDKKSMLDAMIFIANAPREHTAQLRPIFLAAMKERKRDDQIFYVLAENGMYDFVVGSPDPIQAIKTLIETPAKRGDVITYLNHVDVAALQVDDLKGSAEEGAAGTRPQVPELSPTPIASDSMPPTRSDTSGMAPSSADTSPIRQIPVQEAIDRSRGTTKIGVIAPYPRAGASNLSLTVARSIATAGYKVASLISGRDFKTYRNLYPDDYDRGEERIRVSGIDFFCGTKPSFPGSVAYDYVVVDFGSMATVEEKKAKEADFLTTDIRLVQLPLGHAREIRAAINWVEAQDIRNLQGMTIFTYSSVPEVHERFAAQLHEKCPKAALFMRGYQPWPLMLRGIPKTINEALHLKKDLSERSAS